MSKKQKILISVGLLIVILLLLAFYVYKKDVETKSVSSTGNSSFVERYNDHVYGFSFIYLQNWTLNRSGNVLTLGNVDQYGDSITVVEVKGNTVTTSNDKYGSVTYTYQNGKLMVVGTPDPKTGKATSTLAVPIFTTGNNWAVLPGTSSAKTDIVFIPGKGFVIVDSGKSANNANSVDLLVKSFVAIPSNVSDFF